ncbi:MULTISPECIES: heme-binding protein [unclassified Sphingopyxis]|uniref:GlcG/HbpS family heme-binding protein n=1 Tax=Sphingopyxis TaxID=165697 RepID=UPI001E48EF59|nr:MULTISPECIES: heme-binding protein [unclassified Sphingopyxis]HEV7342051.1 heme-binding protein [Sphingopyxis sp.]
MEAVAAAVGHGTAGGTPVVAAVVGASGELVAFLKGGAAPFHSEKIAQDKAFTAASFKVPTAAVYELVSGSEALCNGIAHQPRVVMFGGGVPIIVDGNCIGGIGVSGGSEEFDIACARAAAASIGAKEF